MSNRIIPKEQLSAYQRWELDVLNEGGRGPRAEEQPQGESVPLPTAEEIERIHQQAHEEGFAAGYAEGRAEIARHIAELTSLMESIHSAVSTLDEQVAKDLVDLSLEVAKKMVRQALAVKPVLIVEIVRDAINALPSASHHPQLVLHPADAELIRQHLEADLAHFNIRIKEDGWMARGGCKIETSQGELDATMRTRWQSIVAAIGASSDWLD